MDTDKHGDTSCWTKAQTYLALGNALHVLARLRIDSTPMEGISEVFAEELGVGFAHTLHGPLM